LQTRRSIRRFKSDLVPAAVIERILTTATFASSAHHRQPWRFVVLTDASAKTNLASIMAKDFQHDLEADNLLPEEVEKKVARSRDRIITAPVVVILCVDMSEMDTYPDAHRNHAEYIMATQSTANAGMLLLLAAHAEGLGGVWVCSPLFAQETVRKALDLSTAWEPQAMYFLGYPLEIPEARIRKPIKEIVKTFKRSNPL